MTSEDWRDPQRRAVAILMDGGDDELLLLVNGSEPAVAFERPVPCRDRGISWEELVDTGSPAGEPRPLSGSPVVLQPFSLRLLVRK
jgi:pullulanase/glycogen debranching enzyme